MSTFFENSDAANDHGHHHHHLEQEPIISKHWKWAAALGNVAIGVFEGFGGGVSGVLHSAGAGSTALAADALHNIGDGAGYFIQAETVLRRTTLSKEAVLKRRKLCHTIICLGSLAVAGKAGMDIALDHELSPDLLTVYAASASLALNSLLMANLYRGIRHRNKLARRTGILEAENDLIKHMAWVDMPSAVLALGGAVGQRYGIDIDAVLAAASGTLGAWVFRPTKANIAHDHTLENCHAHQEQPPGVRWHEKISAQLWASGICIKHRLAHWKEKLAARSEITGFQRKSWLRKVGLGVLAVGTAVGAAALYRMSDGSLAPEQTITPRLPAIPGQPLAPHLEMAPNASGYSGAAMIVEQNEGWGQTFDELTIPIDQHTQLLAHVGPELQHIQYANGIPVAYFDTDVHEWRINASPDGRLPIEALTAIVSQAINE